MRFLQDRAPLVETLGSSLNTLPLALCLRKHIEDLSRQIVRSLVTGRQNCRSGAPRAGKTTLSDLQHTAVDGASGHVVDSGIDRIAFDAHSALIDHASSF